MNKLLTIVIPTYNEGKYIARTLYAIAAQSGTHKVKIIIADAKSTDNTRTIAEINGFELGLNLMIIDGGCCRGRSRLLAVVVIINVRKEEIDIANHSIYCISYQRRVYATLTTYIVMNFLIIIVNFYNTRRGRGWDCRIIIISE